MFLPTTVSEAKRLGWDPLDIILVTGDSYIDSPLIGTALIGKLLVKEGFKVGIIAQPALSDLNDIGRLGQPALFWGVTGGSLDSMVANYTSLNKKRRSDDYTPGGLNNRRPDRACIAYTNLIRRFSNAVSKKAAPIVLGGVEASLRRIAHYDFWTDQVRRSILFDSRADYLLYGMAEKSVLQLARHLRSRDDPPHDQPGLCYVSNDMPEGSLQLPSYEECASDRDLFGEMFKVFYSNNDPKTAKRLCQKHKEKFLVHNPPQPYESQSELDSFYDLEFEREQHPYYEKLGSAKALETIRFSIPTHRGCYGQCNFCSIAMHEGRTVRWRSQGSIIKEAKKLAKHPKFKGTIQDLTAPTANMYGFECSSKLEQGCCENKRCLFPKACSQLKVSHQTQIGLLEKLRKIDGVKNIFICSGIRHDLFPHDRKYGMEYLKLICRHHVSGQLKVAPEHSVGSVLDLMGKPSVECLLEFKRNFDLLSREAGKKQFLTYYFISAHPGCSEEHMRQLSLFLREKLRIKPEQVQVFSPTPSTWSSLMYYLSINPWNGTKLFVEKDDSRKRRQKEILIK